MVLAWCFLRRHLAADDVSGIVSASGWYQAGGISCTWGDSLMAARLVLYFLATRSILMMSSPSSFVRLPLIGGSQDCMNVLILARADVCGGAALLIRVSVTIAHMGREGVRFRYSFSQV